MERQSDKHSPRMDDAMAQEVESMLRSTPVESRTREDRLKEDLDDMDPDAGPSVRPDLTDGIGRNPPPGAVEERSELARHVTAAHWPATAAELAEVARADHAPDRLLAQLRALPGDATFENVQDLWAALGGPTEGAHTHG